MNVELSVGINKSPSDVKNILMSAIILLLISLNVDGQQPQDTLYLKNGYKAVGKLLWESKSECRFLTSEGIYFTFSTDEVEKIVTPQELIMRKVNPDTLNAYQLNIYMDKAIKMRNTGRALTISGVSIFAAGIVTGVILMNTGEPPDDPEEKHGPWLEFSIIGIAGVIGIPCTLVGVPLWAVGGSRKTRAELSLQKFNIVPENSMALGLGITIRF
jgi:hypothetical protein